MPAAAPAQLCNAQGPRPIFRMPGIPHCIIFSRSVNAVPLLPSYFLCRRTRFTPRKPPFARHFSRHRTDRKPQLRLFMLTLRGRTRSGSAARNTKFTSRFHLTARCNQKLCLPIRSHVNSAAASAVPAPPRHTPPFAKSPGARLRPSLSQKHIAVYTKSDRNMLLFSVNSQILLTLLLIITYNDSRDIPNRQHK